MRRIVAKRLHKLAVQLLAKNPESKTSVGTLSRKLRRDYTRHKIGLTPRTLALALANTAKAKA